MTDIITKCPRQNRNQDDTRPLFCVGVLISLSIYDNDVISWATLSIMWELHIYGKCSRYLLQICEAGH